MELNIWRAPTDNDMYIRAKWENAHFHEAYTRAYKVETIQNQYGVIVMSHVGVVAPTVQKILDVELVWKMESSGRITASMEVSKDAEFPELPRFGVRVFFNKNLSEASYYGMGPQESYRDKHRAASHGLYRSAVKDLHEDYIMPQEMAVISIVIMLNCTTAGMESRQCLRHHFHFRRQTTHRKCWHRQNTIMNWKNRTVRYYVLIMR